MKAAFGVRVRINLYVLRASFTLTFVCVDRCQSAAIATNKKSAFIVIFAVLFVSINWRPRVRMKVERRE